MSVQYSAAAPVRAVFGSVDPNSLRQLPNASDKSGVSVSDQTRLSKVLGAQESPQIILQQEALALDWKDAQKSLDHLFEDCLKGQFMGVPKIAMPKVFRANGVTLFQHQVDGIRWLTHREKTNETPAPFFTERKFGSKVYWSDKIQSGRVNYEEKPEPVKGSILADEMGIGKTLQTIGLILSSRPAGVRAYPIKTDMPNFCSAPRCTLIVAPVSVMANWVQEFNKYVNKEEEVLTIAFYQGYNRHKTLAQVQAGTLDVLIASYETVSADFNKAKKLRKQRYSSSKETEDQKDSDQEMDDTVEGLIFDVLFHRLVLDEAHTIRNSSTKAFRACKKVQSVNKLALTGTPFINNPMDIQSLFSIMGVHPLEDKQVFNDYIQQPILDRKEIGLSKLRLSLASLCLRRTKACLGQTVAMVSKSVELRKVGFTGPHKDVHDKFYETCRKGYLALLSAGGDHFRKKAFSLFGLMLRIRQSCCSAHLLPESDCKAIEMVWEDFSKVDVDILDKESGLDLFELLVGALRSCREITDDVDSITKRRRVETKNSPQIIPRNLGRSPKIISLLDAIQKMAPGEKGVVYSQWTTFLDVIELELVKDSIFFTRIDGSMDASSRLCAMEIFDTEGTNSVNQPKVMLCSLKAAGTGINLTRANHVYMMDCWWNVAQENQAMDRVHRIGQTRPVQVIRFVMSDSIEERVLRVQEAKQTLGNGILKRLKKEERGKAKVTALRDLFEMDQHKIVDWQGVFDDEEDGLHDLIMGED